MSKNTINAEKITQNSELLSRKEASTYLGIAEQTLAIWKCTGRYHLPYVKIGRLVKYRMSDLNAFITNNLCGAYMAGKC